MQRVIVEMNGPIATGCVIVNNDGQELRLAVTDVVRSYAPRAAPSVEIKLRARVEERPIAAAAPLSDLERTAAGRPALDEDGSWSDGMERKPYVLELSAIGSFKDAFEATAVAATLAMELDQLTRPDDRMESVTVANIDGEFLKG